MRKRKKMKIKHLSVSQLGSFERNPRYWIYSKVLKLPQTGSKALTFGTEAHDLLENYLKGTVKFEEAPEIYSKYLDSFINHEEFDKIVKDSSIEKGVVVDMDGKEYCFIGRVDLYSSRYGFLEVPLILDFKFLANTKYAPSAYELKSDRQVLFYAYYALKQTKFKAKGVRIKHIQFIKSRTGKRKDVGDYVDTFVCKARILKSFFKLIKECEKVEETLQTFKDQGVDGIEDNCKNCCCRYGPQSCEYEGICNNQVTQNEYAEIYFILEELLDRKPYSPEMVRACTDPDMKGRLLSLKESDKKALLEELLNHKPKHKHKGKDMKDIIISPKVEALFINLTSPDNFDGKYAVTIKLDPGIKEHAEFIGALTSATEEGKATLAKDGSASPFREFVLRKDKDKDGNETGLLLFRASSKYLPNIFDKSGAKTELETELGRGSTVKIKVNPRAYDFRGNSGVTFYLTALQVLEEVEYEPSVPSEETF
jgi:hypothetical protein